MMFDERRLRVVLFLLMVVVWSTNALITLDTIKALTAITEECRLRIESVDGVGLRSSSDQMQIALDTVTADNSVGWSGEGDRDEIEINISAALKVLNNDLWKELEKPMDALRQTPLNSKECGTVIEQYHTFLKQTTLFIYAIQANQVKWRWRSDSLIVDDLSFLQALWASRKPNAQDRSFIEQQLSLYNATECFGKRINRDVLRRDVEVVEYLNDVLDMFQ